MRRPSKWEQTSKDAEMTDDTRDCTRNVKLSLYASCCQDAAGFLATTLFFLLHFIILLVTSALRHALLIFIYVFIAMTKREQELFGNPLKRELHLNTYYQ